MEVIILAGGKGTRLVSVLNDKPKCMADVNGRPFLAYLLAYLEDQGVQHVILSLGHLHEQVIDWIKTKAFTFKISWVIEKTPLGTGGAIKLAIEKAKTNKVIVINGDTYFPIDLSIAMGIDLDRHKAVLCLKKMSHPDRYGTVRLNEHQEIISFEEKKKIHEGLINAGVYIISKSNSNLSQMPQAWSFEKDFLELNTDGQLLGIVYDDYFIDIGIPEDYAAFQQINQ